ncbi:hypothetical protein VaNZ11_002361 [Volvox africanus]|uniref:Peptidase M11 gametolysin domain-containing protein n=1 Tax=Volvox africanus TaxID=51714 RepID=A0ABQ5RRR4_9CHLO|nr:hypothetical protein VaNZ11_002361 [Volvox africanus]
MFRKLLLAIFALFAASGVPCCKAAQSPPATTSNKVQIIGELINAVSDRGANQWFLRDVNGTTITLTGAYKVPDMGVDGAPIQGSVVQLACLFNATTGECLLDGSTSFNVMNPVKSPPVLTMVTLKLLVMIVDYPECGFPATITEDEVRSLYLGPNQDGEGGVAQKYEQCSNGQFVIDSEAFRAIRVPHKCSTPITSSCSYWAVEVLANAATKNIIGAGNFSAFTHYTYVLPPGLRPLCSWDGVALLPGRQTWLQTTPNGVYRWATVMQTALRNYGLWNAWRSGVEFGDNSTCMGRGEVCPNAAEISRLGWATAAVGGDQLDKDILLPGSAKTFILPATYLTGNYSYLRVVPDWLSTYDAIRGKNLYMAVRAAQNGDTALLSEFASKVNIHEVNATMDNSYPSSYLYNDRRVQFINATGNLSVLILNAYNLTVYGGSWVDVDTMRVHLCRFVNSPNECPPLSILEATNPANPVPSPSPVISLPPSTPLSPSPPPPLPPPPPRPRPPSPRPPRPSPPRPPSPRPSPPRRSPPPPPPRRSPPPNPPSPSPPRPRSPPPSLPPPPKIPPPRPSPSSPSTACPPVVGYSVTADTTHRGDDIGCDNISPASTAASQCNMDTSCRAFTTFTGRAGACIKNVSTPTATAPGVCLYTKTTTYCRLIPDYILTPGADMYKAEISCENITPTVAAQRCTESADCKAFNTYFDAGVGIPWACTQSGTGPLKDALGVCYYVKSNTTCPQVPGFTLAADQDHAGDDLTCDQTSLTDTISRCKSDYMCQGFSTLYSNLTTGALRGCTKSVTSPIISKAGSCLYTKVLWISIL